VHRKLGDEPYAFSRIHGDDRVVAAPFAKGEVSIPVAHVYKDGQMVRDAYSGITSKVEGGMVKLLAQGTVLLEAQ